MKHNNLIIYLFSLTLFILVTIILTNNPQIKVNNFDYQKCSEITYEESLKLHPKNFKSFNLKISFFSEKNWKKRILKDKIQSYDNKKRSSLKYQLNYLWDPRITDEVILDVFNSNFEKINGLGIQLNFQLYNLCLPMFYIHLDQINL